MGPRSGADPCPLLEGDIETAMLRGTVVVVLDDPDVEVNSLEIWTGGENTIPELPCRFVVAEVNPPHAHVDFEHQVRKIDRELRLFTSDDLRFEQDVIKLVF